MPSIRYTLNLLPIGHQNCKEFVRLAGVEFRGVSKVFGKDVRAVDNLNLKIEDQEFMVLVGPSGCGKTTALRMIAGLEEATSGDLMIGDRRVNDVPPKDRDIAMVFQNYALYPHMSVYENIAFSLKLRDLKGFWWQLLNMGEQKKFAPRLMNGYAKLPRCWILITCWRESRRNYLAASGNVLPSVERLSESRKSF
ncbi:ABC transporter ATP-binding protein [Kamptonema cortianum]|nr:ABC transporter ATP-binding protein [Kamptonema cortianum]